MIVMTNNLWYHSIVQHNIVLPNAKYSHNAWGTYYRILPHVSLPYPCYGMANPMMIYYSLCLTYSSCSSHKQAWDNTCTVCVCVCVCVCVQFVGYDNRAPWSWLLPLLLHIVIANMHVMFILAIWRRTLIAQYCPTVDHRNWFIIWSICQQSQMKNHSIAGDTKQVGHTAQLNIDKSDRHCTEIRDWLHVVCTMLK